MGNIANYNASVFVARSEKDRDPKNDLHLSVSEDIYFERDNSSGAEFKITQEFIDSLKPGDKILLFTDGSE